MYGALAKLGVIIPSNNTVIEPELWAMRPDGISIHSARVLSYGNTPEGIVRMEESAMRAAGELGAGRMSLIAYACMATSLVKGPEWDQLIANRIQSQSGGAAITAAGATIAALRSVDASRVSLATAYPPRLNALVAGYFGSFGISVAAMETVDTGSSLELWRLSPAEMSALGRRAYRRDVHAIAFLATDIPTISALDSLEQEMGIPVIGTNQALLWQSLRVLNIPCETTGYGRLLATMSR
jgi:maleate isomerase